MARKRTTKKTQSKPRSKGGGRDIYAAGKHLVIVESPAKAKTINQYLGPDYVVTASVGHVRDLPARAPKGSKQPVPGVDIDRDFEPTYEVLPDKKKVVTQLKKAAKQAQDVWFATDLDREGEAIAWHLAQELGIDVVQAKRVIFNAITRSEIQRAFQNPHQIDEYKVNAQQARRILDRIVGYQVSPLLWKKVARGLSAGRVQSVAVRLVVEREREIRTFVPDESWRVTGRFTDNADRARQLAGDWQSFLTTTDEKGNQPTIKSQNAWMAERKSVRGELIELGGKKFELGCKADDPRDLSLQVINVAEAVGMTDVRVDTTEDEDGKGPARYIRAVSGRLDPAARYRVSSIETKRTTSRPQPPFITSSLQVAASTYLRFGADRTMRTAQSLYEGVNVRGEGQVGLITYMRTDSTHLDDGAIQQARGFIGKQFGDRYLPDKANYYTSSNKAAQEAHEAIRPTDVSRTPEDLASSLDRSQLDLYRLIWNRFVACQMTPAEWDSTTVLMKRTDRETGAVFKASGRVLVFDGFYRVTGVPTQSDEQTLPSLNKGEEVLPFSLEPEQRFSSPPPRYTEASLVKTLEAEGIGRPSTYASIIGVIQDRKYVEQIERRFHATDLGEVVTDKLIEGFPDLMDLGYTRELELKLDKIEEAHTDWVSMLHSFYDQFSHSLEQAHETMAHAKAETFPSPYKCPECGSRTCYRFGKNGRFLSCSAYPECNYAAPIDRDGHPLLPERVNVACPEDGSDMILRSGRFGPFLASVNYPQTKYVINLDKKGQIKYPATPPLVVEELKCPKCESPMNLRRGKRGPWLGCSAFPKCRGRVAWTSLTDEKRQELEKALELHEKNNPQPVIRTLDGRVIPDGSPIEDLMLDSEVAELEIHPDAQLPAAKSA